MGKVAYITGSSKGIGRALAVQLLDAGYQVIGLSRTNEVEDPNFRFDQIDLADLDKTSGYNFDVEGEEVILVNNAGIIDDIGPIGSVSNDSIAKVMNVNTLSPQILSNNFIKKFNKKAGKYHIINISSGAGKKAITSWATYCASKAAIDLFSETIAEELEWQQLNNWHIHSCAPGVVDTQMQADIRTSNPKEFQHVQNFIDYKNNNDLYSADYVAVKLLELIQNPDQFKDVVMSVRDY